MESRSSFGDESTSRVQLSCILVGEVSQSSLFCNAKKCVSTGKAGGTTIRDVQLLYRQVFTTPVIRKNRACFLTLVICAGKES